MQQANEGGSEGMTKQNQDRRLTKPMMQGDNPQHHQPQKCPRCESLNTKFCYYNNYSLSQPRYFCKTCRRYWTQGGTLRNVPVGGGCRKGKRAKTSSSAASASSSENSRPQIQSHPQPLTLGTSQNMINSTPTNSGNLSGLRTKELGGTLVSPAGSGNGIPSMPMGSFYSGGGFLNSLAAIQSLSNQTLPQSFALNNHQPLSGDLGRTSNLNLLHGFNAVPSFGLQVQAQQRQFYHMGSSTENKSTSIGEHPYFATSSQSQHQNWHQDQAFISNTNPAVPDSTAFWSISTSNTPLNSTAASAGSFPLNPTDHQWRDLPGYGPPP